MKKGIKLLIAGMLILAIGGCKSENNLEQKLDTNKIYKIGTTAEYPPFETLENGKIVGYDVDVIDEVAKKIGIKYEWKDMNFDGLISALQSQKIDVVIAGISSTPEREKVVIFSTPYHNAKIKSENNLEQKLDTNKIYKIGTTAEYPPFETLENGKIVGYDVDVIDEVAKKIGIKYEWKDMNFD